MAAILDGRDLPPKTASVSEWAAGEAGQADYPTPVGAAENTESTARAVSAVLTVEETRDLLTRLPMIAGCRVDDILLAAAAGAMRRAVVNLENHGRGLTGLDVSRTVGWFTAFRTVSLDVPASLSPGRLLETVCEQATRDSEPTVAPRVSLNYLGQFDRPVPSGSPFSLTRERLGSERSPQNRRPHEVDIAAAVFAGQMHIEWIYGSALCERSVAERQVESFVGTLRALIEHYVRSGVPAEATDVYPLAPQQQGMLLESLVGALPGVHVEQLTCRLEGPLDADRFRTAWASVIARHSVLRTCFLWRGRTRPLQVVYNSVEVPVETGIWESDNLDAYLDTERRRGFQLDRAPLMRLGLFRLTDHSHRFVWTQHHAILDGWCQPLVLGEVLRTYRDGGTEEDAPEYGHYLAYIKRQDLAACESFWRSQLEGFRTPTSPGRLCSESEKIAWPETFQTADVTLDHGLTVELEDAARAGHVSLSTLVTGAWALLLARYSGSDDVLFGLTVAGRPADLSGAGKIVGLMANTLPLRIRIQDEAPIWSWIGEVGQAQAGIRMYETSPPDSVRRSSQVPAAMPLHDSVLVFENYPVEALSKNTAGLGFTIQEIAFHGARTQQTVAIIAVPGHQLSLRFVFDRRRIDPGSIHGDFQKLSMVAFFDLSRKHIHFF